MMAFVLSLIWRQIGAVGESVRVLNQEGLLWVNPTPVSQAGVMQRLKSLPAVLFENVLSAILSNMMERWGERSRPIPPAIAFARQRFGSVVYWDSPISGPARLMAS